MQNSHLQPVLKDTDFFMNMSDQNVQISHIISYTLRNMVYFMSNISEACQELLAHKYVVIPRALFIGKGHLQF